MPVSRLKLALRLLLRDWRAGELRVLLAALVIAVAATTAIGFFADRLQRALSDQSAEMLGADLVLSTSRDPDPAWLKEARSAGLRYTQSLEFPSVVLHGDALQLCEIKAVQAGYPLRGALRTAAQPFGEESETRALPTAGEAWVEARLLPLLQAQVGDAVTLGELSLTITRVLTFQPGSGGNLAGVAPTVLIAHGDAQRAGVLAPGSRINLQTQFAGEPAALSAYQRWLKPRLGSSDRLVDVRAGRPGLGSALDKAERYLGLASLAAVLLAGVAIAMGARRYSERHFDVSAMLRCLGASQNDLLALYLPQLLVIGLIGSGLGVALGFAAQFGLLQLLQEWLPSQLPPPGPLPALLGLFTGLVVLAGFALPPVMRLKQVPALRVLRRELTPLPLSAWLIQAAALAAMGVLLWRYTGDATLTLAVLAGVVLALLAFGALAWLLLRSSRVLRGGVGVAWRYGLNNLWRRPWLAAGQILAFGLVLTVMALVALLRGDLLDTWRSQMPAQAPNHFVINVLPEQVTTFETFLRERHLTSAQLYPMVRGQLATVNGLALAEHTRRAATEGEDARPLQRELNLTWSDHLQADNAIVTGRWWQPADHGQPLVSVEQGLAERLNLKLGDELGFNFGGQPLTVKVASLRTVRWDSFKPNFFMIFPPGVIERFPATYITSFYLPPGQNSLMARMVRSFPAVTVIDLERIMEQARRVLAQVTLAVEYVLILVLLAGFAVLYAALQASLDQRLVEGALLRALGASRQQLRAGHLAEYALLGALAGLFAAIATELVAWLLYSRVFDLHYLFKWPLWLILPPLGAVLIGAAGYWGTRRVAQHTPLAVMRGV